MHAAISKSLKFFSDLAPRVILDLANFKHTIFLAGTGRSGTTWLEDVINFDGSHRVMFEPFHSRRTPIVREWNYRQYLRPSNREERFLSPATQILSGKVRSKWIDQVRCKSIVRKRLIKDIRANLFLKWIKQHFPAIRIVLFLRHPCAVAGSKLQLGWETHLEDFLTQQDLMEDFLEPFRSHIAHVGNTFEKHVFMWCIENYVPLRQFAQSEICVMHYENFCTAPKESIEVLFRYLDQPFCPELLRAIDRPSAVSRADSAIRKGLNLIDAWRRLVSSQQIDRAIEILQLFGLHEIYGESSLPRTQAGETLLKQNSSLRLEVPRNSA